eukprot:TRINITY_DN20200_c0_g1_i1.p1 TRINITY_DN20200_c0_g1~~TRINITY_DN20200_c0_g1_i1.p1  ORF type:complete len:782 (-),score=273.35 TRINITY_DN20200_c0_g1_i1:139-2484(-)
MDWGVETVPVPRALLSELLEDGTCPVHLRLQLQRLLFASSSEGQPCSAAQGAKAASEESPGCSSEPPCPVPADCLRGSQRFTPRLQQTLNQRQAELREREEAERRQRQREEEERMRQAEEQQLMLQQEAEQRLDAEQREATQEPQEQQPSPVQPAPQAEQEEGLAGPEAHEAQAPAELGQELQEQPVEAEQPAHAEQLEEQDDALELQLDSAESAATEAAESVAEAIAEAVDNAIAEAVMASATRAEQEQAEEQAEAPEAEAPQEVQPSVAEAEVVAEVELVTPEEAAVARAQDQEDRFHQQKLQLAVSKKVPFPTRLEPTCLVLVVCGLSLEEILALRAVNFSCLQWAMHGAITQLGEVCKAHHRIRTRLWISRLEEINSSTADETVYESKVRQLADDALRRRMEAEMADARQDMEDRIRDFHVEVDRRMEAQAVRVHAIVEERVQQQLDTILAAEMEKVRVLVEERVQGRVRQVVQREVYATVCEMQAKLASLAKENEKLRTVFLEHLDHSDLCFRSLVWALSPNATGMFARTLRFIWCCRRRFTRFSAWMLGVPMDRRRDILRTRLEMMHQAGELRAAQNREAASQGRKCALTAPQGDSTAEEHAEAPEAVEGVEHAAERVTLGEIQQKVSSSSNDRPAEEAPDVGGLDNADAAQARECSERAKQTVCEPRQELVPNAGPDEGEAGAASDDEEGGRLTEPPSGDEDDDPLRGLLLLRSAASSPIPDAAKSPPPEAEEPLVPPLATEEGVEVFQDAEEPVELEEEFQDAEDGDEKKSLS